MTDEWKPDAEYAVTVFARRCINHPRLNEDPECVIATERERMLAEIGATEEVEIPHSQMEVAHVSGKRQGKEKRR